MWTEGVQRFCSIPISQDWDWRPNSRKLFGMLSPVEISPHLCVGFLFLVLHLRLSASPPLRLVHTQLVHTHLVNMQVVTQLVHTQLVYIQLVHTRLVHTQLVHTQLVNTQLVNMQLATQLVHTPWQAWHLVTSIVPLRGRRGTWWHPPSLWRGRCVARSGRSGRGGRRRRLRGRCGTWWHPSSLCVAAVALGDIHRHSGVAGVALLGLDWLRWRARAAVDAVVAAAVCVAGVALRWHPSSLCVAGVALGDIHRHFGVAAPVAWTGLVLVARLSTHTLSTHNLSQLVHTTCPHTTCRHTFVAHANPSPSLFSFPHFPSHLYLSFASYWKKLTCGVIRSFNWFLFSRPSLPELVYVFFKKSCLKHSSPSSQTQNRKRFSSEDDMQSSWFPTTLYFTNPWNLCGSASIFLSLRVDWVPYRLHPQHRLPRIVGWTITNFIKKTIGI